MNKISENPVLYGLLCTGFAFLPELTIASQIVACFLCANLYALINKKIMPTRAIFNFGASFCVSLIIVSWGFLFYQHKRGLITSLKEPFLQIFPVSIVSFFIAVFTFFIASIVINGLIIIFQGKNKY
ncbi:MAG: hypothetical protein LUE64_01450 [Candidatus Gastranaerophilales bacterium]|nr:hypothetical protein [Candidatus Gastranaerophilales bacterium]